MRYWWEIAVVAVCLLFVVSRMRRRRGGPRSPVFQTSLSAGAGGVLITIPADLEPRVRTLVAQNQLIQAVKEVRERTGCGLKQAKDVVDAVKAGRQVPVSGRSGTAGADLATRVRDLLGQDRRDDAIVLVHDETGMSLADAQTFVDAL